MGWQDAPLADDEPDDKPIWADAPLAEVTPDQDPNLKEEAPGVFSKIRGAGEVASAIATTALAEPVAGLAGLAGAALPGEEGQGARWVEATRGALTDDPDTDVGKEYMADVASFLAPVGEALGAVEGGLGEATLEATGSPTLATLAHSAPTALMEVLGLGLLRKPSSAAAAVAKAQERIRIDPKMTPEEVAVREIEPEMRSHVQIAEALRKDPDVKDIAEEVRPDADIKAAAEALGVELNPSHYSTNEAYRRVEQAIKSQPKSRQLAAREAEAITKLGERADELVSELGSLDRSLLDVEVRTNLDTTIEGLRKAASRQYDSVNDAIPPATKVTGRASRAYLDQRLAEMGGDVSGLSKAEQAMHKVFDAERPPTYARLNQLRKDVGGAYKRQGPFADDLSGNLDQVYRVLIADQQGVAEAFGIGDQFAAGRKLVADRKALEEQAVAMFGRDLNKSILPQLTRATTGLAKGDTLQLSNLMKALPAEIRPKAAATILNDLFTHGTRLGGSLGAGFARAYESLSRNAGARATLFKYLPKEAQSRFEAIGKVSMGLYRAKALENTSKTARDLLEVLQNGGAVARIMDQASDTILGRMTFVPGPTRWVASGIKASKTVAKEQLDKVRAADNLMSSSAFNNAIAKAAEGKVKQAETMLKRSQAWQRWRNLLGEGTKAQLAAMGPIAWLTQQEEPTVQPGAPIGQ